MRNENPALGGALEDQVRAGSSDNITALDRVRAALESFGPVKMSGGSILARCPAHEDRNPSLSVRGIDGQVLVFCHAGCETRDVVAALGLTMRDLFDDPRGIEYRYDNGRTVTRTPDKRFRQAHTDHPPELYRLAKVKRAVAAGETIYVCEGEKDVHAAESARLTATCCPMGAGKWGKIDPTPLHGATVIVVADRDAPGMKHAADIIASLEGKATVTVVQAAEGKDLADHLAAGHDAGELVPIDLAQLDRGPARRLVLTAASTITLRAPRWLWDTAEPDAIGPAHEGRIPVGSLTIAAGRAGIGKSQHAAWLAGHITRGTLPGCWHGRPRSVIYAASEDSWSMTIAPRLAVVGADLDRVFRIDVHDDDDPHARLTLPTDTRLLEDAITRHDVALMVLDPLLSLLDSGINDYRAREVRDALEPLLPIADRTGCALFGLAHFTKAGGADPLLLIAGSGAFGQLVRAGIGYARDEDADAEDGPAYVMSTIKSNLGREDLPSLTYRIEPAKVDTADGPAWVSRLAFTGSSDRSVRDLLRDGMSSDRDDSDGRHAVDEWLAEYLRPMDRESRALYSAADAAGYSKDQVKRAKKRLKILARHPEIDGPWFWSLPSRERLGVQGSTRTDVAPLHPLSAPLEANTTPPAERRTHEEPEELTHEYVRPSSSSASPSAPIPLPNRPCGHPGDPSKRCGACIAESLNRAEVDRPRECAYCTRPALPGSDWCDTDDAAHEHARKLMGIAS